MPKPRPQRKNANKHRPEGMAALEQSLESDGWIGAITVAADGETFDGSARLEVLGDRAEDAIVVEVDGSRPVIVKRTDIASADDPKAKRLGVAANRVAQMNLRWDVDILEEISQEVDLEGLIDEDFLEDLVNASDPLAALEDEEDDPPADFDPDRYPLAIVLDWATHRQWDDLKVELGYSSDTQAFKKLLENYTRE